MTSSLLLKGIQLVPFLAWKRRFTQTSLIPKCAEKYRLRTPLTSSVSLRKPLLTLRWWEMSLIPSSCQLERLRERNQILLPRHWALRNTLTTIRWVAMEVRLLRFLQAFAAIVLTTQWTLNGLVLEELAASAVIWLWTRLRQVIQATIVIVVNYLDSTTTQWLTRFAACILRNSALLKA